MDNFAQYIGYFVMSISAITSVLFFAIFVAQLGNRAQRKLLDMYGGWKVFLRYRDWYLYQQNKEVK